jgi:uncharacterized membrane protein
MENRSFGYLVNKNWFILFSIIFVGFIGLPFLAPILMEMGLPKGASIIYSVYKFLCHQLPQRSFFLFGDETMYSLQEIQNAWQVTINPMVLRRFIGNPQMGWKVAWSDRMISMYTSILITAWVWYPLRKKFKGFPFWGFALLLLPMGIDGITHMISDFSGIGQGFRDSNLWLAEQTGHRFSDAFYAGDALGSFNSWMRFMTGLSFGIGIVLFGFPYIAEIFETNLESYQLRHQRLFDLKTEALNDIMGYKDKKPLERKRKIDR